MTDDWNRDDGNAGEAERRVYYPEDEETSISERVMEAIEAYEGVDVTRSEFVLFDAIDPDALDRLFRTEADADVVVEFTVDDVRVTLLGDGGVDVRVSHADRFDL